MKYKTFDIHNTEIRSKIYVINFEPNYSFNVSYIPKELFYIDNIDNKQLNSWVTNYFYFGKDNVTYDQFDEEDLKDKQLYVYTSKSTNETTIYVADENLAKVIVDTINELIPPGGINYALLALKKLNLIDL